MSIRLSFLICVLLTMPAEAGERIPLYPGPVPGSEDWSHTEREYHSEIFNTQVVTNVANPSLEVFLPEHGNGTAVDAWRDVVATSSEGTGVPAPGVGSVNAIQMTATEESRDSNVEHCHYPPPGPRL